MNEKKASVPALFVGSSTEGLGIARAVRSLLSDDADVTLWNEGLFSLGSTFIETLVNELPRFDFAAVVLTPDDLVHSRNLESFGPRDNTLFELGLFTAGLGRSRTFIIRERNVKLPTDLSGVTMAVYSTPSDHSRLQSALGPACDSIRDAIRALGVSERKSAARIGQLEVRQEHTESNVKTLQILVRGLVTEWECDKLRGLRAEGPFMVRFHRNMLDEVLRLRALGYVAPNPGRGITHIKERDGSADEFDLKQYMHITDQGREYLKLRE